MSISIFYYGTSQKSERDRELLEILKKDIDFCPGVIVRDLGLEKSIYQRTTAYGHFGRDSVPLEVPKKLKYSVLAFSLQTCWCRL